MRTSKITSVKNVAMNQAVKLIFEFISKVFTLESSIIVTNVRRFLPIKVV